VRVSSRKILLALFVLTASVACREVFVEGPPCTTAGEGPFSGDASGAESRALRGCATYAVSSSTGSAVTGLVLKAGSTISPSPIVSLARSGPRPPVGTYTIGVNAANFAGSVLLNPGGSFGLTSGTVTIDVSADGTLGGTLNVTGTQSGTGSSITITGTFSALCTPSGSVTC
jgi:hypothetical protein